MRPPVGVVTFPGSLDDRDAARAIELTGGRAVPVWHESTSIGDVGGLILPGGFSYGDYLRAGAIARFSPVMGAVRDFAEAGGPVLGICNGFQVLCEAGLLPGGLIRNRGLRFVCRWVAVRAAEQPETPGWPGGQILRVPIKHGEGQFVAAPDALDALEMAGQVALRYSSPDGSLGEEFNPNGSARSIAGVWNEARNVLGLMPHPEHAVDPELGPTGGRAILAWLLAAGSAGASAWA